MMCCRYPSPMPIAISHADSLRSITLACCILVCCVIMADTLVCIGQFCHPPPPPPGIPRGGIPLMIPCPYEYRLRRGGDIRSIGRQHGGLSFVVVRDPK